MYEAQVPPPWWTSSETRSEEILMTVCLICLLVSTRNGANDGLEPSGYRKSIWVPTREPWMNGWSDGWMAGCTSRVISVLFALFLGRGWGLGFVLWNRRRFWFLPPRGLGVGFILWPFLCFPQRGGVRSTRLPSPFHSVLSYAPKAFLGGSWGTRSPKRACVS